MGIPPSETQGNWELHPEGGGTMNSPGFFPIIIVDRGKGNQRSICFWERKV
ncbi:hypothetical protein C943_04213 [Mariniradius saccharolyticus AK6]|uniref:Uncharacterized protein n=1 Tax=Mariniradius saccharolyticus AK6 TaxID=1239962 RepID=M7XGG4_9BACT|nr:hypothetical protein C943_04213 [Mariniradius saccharolyticus AK6]